jgi:ABC-type transport system involved in multi-copper enzyme maturation permease subunit
VDGFFIFVQDMIERAMMEEIVGDRVASPGVYIQEMPYPCFKRDRFTYSLLYVLPLAMLFAWLFPVAMTARAVVREKETRLKEYMKMMGVSEGLLRVSWFLHSMAVLLFSVVGITLLLKLSGILPATDGFILFLFLMLYAVVMLSYSFLVSVFFDNANLAACVAALIYFLVFFAHISIVPNLYSLSPYVIGVCVSSWNCKLCFHLYPFV